MYKNEEESPVITKIHERLDKLEELSADMKEIKEWIATVVRMTLLMEIVGDFLTKWAWRMGKLLVGFGVVWAALRLGLNDLKEFLLRYPFK